jgi:type IV pilus assembly protein PilZ
MRFTLRYERLEDFLVDYASNQAVGALFVRTRTPLEVGTRFRLGLKVPGRARAMHTTAEVRWSAHHGEESDRGMGISFEGLPTRHQRSVDAWIAGWLADTQARTTSSPAEPR